MKCFLSIEANLLWQFIAQHKVHLRSKTDTLPQTNFDNSNDYYNYDDLRAQGLWTIDVAIDKSSVNNHLTLSKQKTNGGADTNGDSG